ncbi:MAG: PhnD/SsuA/transferrin family substrate-binding protein [Thermoanaerobaculia bacterium]|nr:PhnD/SsuA/transferrin family substrate-binding protein [Thermoanaerobaculia bacterium]
MRRIAFAATLAVALLFAALLVPGSPLRKSLLWFLGRPPAGPAVRPSATARPAGSPLRVAVGAMISPERTHGVYGDLFRLLAERLGRPLELKQRRTYREVNGLVMRGEVDAAWICTGAWPELGAARAARIVAVPVVDGLTTYRALILAGPGRPTARSLDDLRGARFAFTDPISLTGCRYPKGRLVAKGERSELFFGSTLYTHGHDRSIESVRRGLADGASVDSLIYDFLARRSPAEVEGVRVLERSGPFPIPPIVVPAGAPETEVAKLRQELRRLPDDPAGRALLEALLIDGFTLPDESAYARLR